MHDARLFRRAVACLLILAIGLPPSRATAGGRDQWNRVTALKPNTHLIVAVIEPTVAAAFSAGDPRVLEGWLVSADASGLVLRHVDSTRIQVKAKYPRGDQPAVSREAVYTRSDEVLISRKQVVQVVVVQEGRPWYALPVAVAAFAGGVLVCVGTIWAMGESGTSGWPSGEDSAWGPFTIFALPVLMGMWAYRKMDDPRRSEKVIYIAPERFGQGGL